MSEPTTATRNVWLAAWYLSRGLRFVRATALPGRAFRVTMIFEDSASRAAGLEREFLDNVAVQRLITARRTVSEGLDVVAARAWGSAGYLRLPPPQQGDR